MITTLDLSSNSLYGPLPSSICILLPYITRLNLSSNSLTGPIPPNISNCTFLNHGFQVPLLHCNLCSSTVLLDKDYEPRITDFGIARVSRQSVDIELDTSPLLNVDLGTTKKDVYDFGVVLLELGTGQCIVDVNPEALVDWVARELSVGGRTCEAIDEYIRGKGKDDEIIEFLNIACRCVVDRPHERPLMLEVYQSLKSIRGSQGHSEDFDEFPLVYGV